VKIISLDHSISDEQRAKHLFTGDLLVYRQRTSMLALIDYTKELLQNQFGESDFTTLQNQLTSPKFLLEMGEVQSHFRQSKAARALFFDVLQECGVDISATYYDHFPLRVVPFSNQHQGAHRAAIGHHRDTWGSNINGQQNWWAPIFSLESERTIAIYPDYWNKPLANTTATWSFEDFLKTRQQTQSERQVDYPSAPMPIASVDESNVVKIVIQPGDVLNFASAHLHASVPNSTQATRFSVEMRTVNQDDLSHSRAAPNIDNAATKPMYQWFKNIETKEPLMHPDSLISSS
jgi:hypothetical protein